MRRKGSSRAGRFLRKTGKPAALFLAIAVMLTGMWMFHVSAQAVDVDRSCQLTVWAGSQELLEQLTEAGVVVDLYKVADAVANEGSDSYSFQLREGYESLQIGENLDNASWKALANEAAKLALAGLKPDVSGAAAGSPITRTDSGVDLSTGLYLIIARGGDIADYTATVTDEDGQETIVTRAYTAGNSYTFLPELVSMPSKPVGEDGQIHMTGQGDWLYEMEVTLKPETEPLRGGLEIRKTLESYESGEPATFVFSVEAELNGVSVYSDVVAMTFTSAGEQVKLIEGIPVGAVVTIEEVYSGASYTLVNDGTQQVVISADQVASVHFTNRYDEREKNGHGITNHFEYSAEDGWRWETRDDGTQE